MNRINMFFILPKAKSSCKSCKSCLKELLSIFKQFLNYEWLIMNSIYICELSA